MKGILPLFACAAFCYAKITILPATPFNVEKFSQLLDIRMPIERHELGIIKNAKFINFSKDKHKLWGEISAQIDTSKPFAIICRSGDKSKFVAELLDEPDLNITIFKGGMKALIKYGYITMPYNN